jgi:glycosyltransferase involved in cell wall biosynthesis
MIDNLEQQFINMKITLAFPDTAPFAQQAARALYEAGMLKQFVTAYHYMPRTWTSRIAAKLGDFTGVDLVRELRRRELQDIPYELVKAYPLWEALRVGAVKTGLGPVWVDRIWDIGSHRFDKIVARRELVGLDAIYSYEYVCLETFRAAKLRGITTIIDLPSPDSGFVEGLLADEVAKFPSLKRTHSDYFDRKLPERLRRRRDELNLADILVANSVFTANSYVAAGVGREKIITVPYGAPEVTASKPSRGSNGPLKILWAGTFSIRKGAHYLLEAWRSLKLDGRAELLVFGAVTLPDSLMANLPASIIIRPTIPRSELYANYRNADVLVFPTLADGFGMVVTEAFANGLPVITTNRAGAADFVRHGENGLIIEAASAAAIAESLLWCLSSRDALVEMRYEARASAASWQWSNYRKVLSEELRDRFTAMARLG